jgi:hypothetical protein
MLGRYAQFSLLLLAGTFAAAACSKEPAPAGKTESPATAKAAETGAPAGGDRGAAKEGAVGGAAPAAAGKPRVEGQGFVVQVKCPAESAAGQEGTAQVVLEATGEYHLNKEFPTKLDVQAPEGVTVGKPKQTVADASSFEHKSATWDVKFTPTAAGEKSLGAEFRFAVCTETTCDPKKESLGCKVAVK